VGSFRFRKSVKIAPGIRLNIGKKSVGVSAGIRGARHSISSTGRRTTSVGIPGSGLSYQTRHNGRDVEPDAIAASEVPSPTRLLARVIGWLALLVFVFGMFSGSPTGAGTIAGVGIVVYIALRLLRPVLDPTILWLLLRGRANDAPS
jgi:hypothetical protein